MGFYYILAALILALAFIMASVLITQNNIIRITYMFYEVWGVELSIKELRILLLVIGIFILMVCGLITIDISSVIVCALVIITGLLLLFAGIFDIKVIITLVLIPNLWLVSFRYKTIRILVSILGCAILIASVSGVFAIM